MCSVRVCRIRKSEIGCQYDVGLTNAMLANVTTVTPQDLTSITLANARL